MAALSEYLEITSASAEAQWAAIRARRPVAPRQRQESFRPVEVILCQALFQLLDPHSYGGSNIGAAPEALHVLARALRRSSGSLTSKMLNLDGSRTNSGRIEPTVFLQFTTHAELLARAYDVTLAAARRAGFSEDEVPDFLRGQRLQPGELLGQDELGDAELAISLEEERATLLPLIDALGERDTERIVEHRVRLGQSRFAARVLANYRHRCAFCGFAPAALGRNRLLVASHVKPWRDCSSSLERLDPRNGVAACPTHDAAFDSYLLSINGGLRIHRADALVAHIKADRVGEAWFAPPALADTLLVPEGGHPPAERYLAHHLARFRAGAQLA